MPGWMGMRGLEPKTPRDMERERREDHKGGAPDMEKRSREKVQEILRDQQGDMSAYTGTPGPAAANECAVICALPAEAVMSAKVAVLSFDDNLLTVQGIFASVKFRHLPVVDDNGGIIGIISDRDLLRTVSPFFGTVNEQNRDKEIMTRKVGTIMTRNPICAGLKTTVMDAVQLMNSRKISCLPIVEGEGRTLLGIITWKDVVRAFCPAGFNRASDSNRLKSGVKLNPETSESARLRARSAESARLRARHSVRDEAKPVSERLAARVRASLGDGRNAPHAAGDDAKGSDRISLADVTPTLGGQEKLRPRSAGQAGSELAAKQRERMNREHPDSSKSARLSARDALDDDE